MTMPAIEPHASNSTDDRNAAYDPVADLYDRAFTDIRVRRDEWRWLDQRMTLLAQTAPPRVLDIGCGNGALLSALQSKLRSGIGVDVSARFIDIAHQRNRACPHLHFQTITDSALPFANDSFDVVLSFLSFRYLDWDAALNEAMRVVRPGGRLLIVDMVKHGALPTDAWLIARSAARHLLRPLRDRRFHEDVARLTAHPDWHRMLQRHPIRPQSEYETCFARWFPGQPIEALNATPSKRVIAIDSGPVIKR